MTHRHVSRRGFALCAAALMTGCASGPATAGQLDLVIANGRVMDPESGFDAIAHVGVRGGTIRAISRLPLQGARMIDAAGHVVAPGFIDLHAHGRTLGDSDLQAQDGVTTALELEIGAFRLATFLASREGQSRTHYGASAGHLAIRQFIETGVAPGPATVSLESGPYPGRMGWVYLRLEDNRLVQLRSLLREEIAAGAIGIGIAPEYLPGADRDEVLAVFEEAAALGAPVFVHTRNTGRPAGRAERMGPVQEMIADAAATGASLHLCHIGSQARSDIEPVLALIRGARAHGVDVTAEVYPYTASATLIGAAIYSDGWRDRTGNDFGDLEWPETGERLTAETFENYRREQPGGLVISHSIPERAVDLAIAEPGVMIASDATRFTNGTGHPRGAGTFARVLGRYVRERRLITLMDALSRMTLLPARRLEKAAPAFRNKGRLRVGADADITVFNPATVIDRATFAAPTQPSAGIPWVIVGGQLAVADGRIASGPPPGRALRSGAS